MPRVRCMPEISCTRTSQGGQQERIDGASRQPPAALMKEGTCTVALKRTGLHRRDQVSSISTLSFTITSTQIMTSEAMFHAKSCSSRSTEMSTRRSSWVDDERNNRLQHVLAARSQSPRCAPRSS